MIPLRDVDSRARGVPVATVALIAANVLVYLFMAGGPDSRFDELTYRYAAIPGNITSKEPVTWTVVEIGDESGSGPKETIPWLPGENAYAFRVKAERAARSLQARGVERVVELGSDTEGQALHPWLTLLSSMFMHGGLMHIGGNMLFLMVFGGRLEHRMGRLRYGAFYLVTGILAGLAHVLFNPASPLPTVGASGAISGLLGGYVLLFPHGRILTLIPIFIIIHLVQLPAYIFVAIWVFYQIMLTGGPGSVAVWAHLGGFAFGLLLIRLMVPRQEPARRHGVRPWSTAPGADPFEHFRR